MVGVLTGNACSGKDAEAAAKKLLTQLENLGGPARLEWQRAYRRVFDVGVQAAGELPPFEGLLSTSNTLARFAALGVELQVTIYPPELEVPITAARPARGRPSNPRLHPSAAARRTT
jgi:hypothetical protein